MVLVAGSANLDFVVRAPRIPAPGETVLGGAFQTFAGGKGANQAVACAHAGGISTHMLLALGDDQFAAPIETSLRAAGVVMHTVRPLGVATGTAFICVADDAENAITVAPGANASLSAQDLPPLGGFSHLLMQLEIPMGAVRAYATAARAADVKVVLNAAPALALPPELLELVDLLVVNEGELRSLSGDPGSIKECLERLPCSSTVVTLGALGCVARHDQEFFVQSGFAIDPVDTTGAGDTFCGVLVAALAQQLPFSLGLRRANAAAALACTQMGAQSSIPSAEAVDACLNHTPDSAHTESAAALRRYAGLP
jgi:ribokinase